jgi:anti-sigma-K factor RskA
MRIGESAALDALCGEYLLGTLRGSARRRFERALREEPRVATRLAYWQRTFVPRPAKTTEIEPPTRVWRALERDLELARYRTPWHRRLGFWRGLAAAATAALVIGIGFQILRTVETERPGVQIAELAGKADVARVVASLSADGRVLELKPARAVIAGRNQSYELWLLPAEGGAPISLAVLGSLDARFPLPPGEAGRLRTGSRLAVSVEPAGGSPTGAPTGPVILVGAVSI